MIKLKQRFFVIGFLASLSQSFAGELGVWATTSSIMFMAESFLTPWSGYQNQSGAVEFRFERIGHRFELGITAHASSVGRLAVLGNIERAKYRVLNNLWVGRMEPTSAVPTNFNIRSRLNQRVCVNPFHCFEGGPIGARWRVGALTATVSTIYIPNFGYTAAIDSDGKAFTSNRWANAIPNEVTFENGTTLPLVHEVSSPTTATLLFKPGFQSQLDVYEGRNIKIQIHAAFQPSPNLAVENNSSLSFDKGYTALVVGNEAKINVIYEGILSGRASFDYSLGTLDLELGVAGNDDLIQGSLAAVQSLNFQSTLVELLASVYQRGPKETYFEVGTQASYKLGEFVFSGRFVEIAGTHRGRMLQPQIAWSFDASNAVMLGGYLVLADVETPVLGSVRGNDNVYARYQYVW